MRTFFFLNLYLFSTHSFAFVVEGAFSSTAKRRSCSVNSTNWRKTTLTSCASTAHLSSSRRPTRSSFRSSRSRSKRCCRNNNNFAKRSPPSRVASNIFRFESSTSAPLHDCVSSYDVTFIVIFLQDTFVEKESVTRLDSKIRDLESRLELEEVSRQRADVRRTQLIKTSTVDHFSYVFFNFCRCCCCCSFSRLAPRSSWRV